MIPPMRVQNVGGRRRGGGSGGGVKKKKKKTIEAYSDLPFLPLLHQKIAGTLSRGNKADFHQSF